MSSPSPAAFLTALLLVAGADADAAADSARLPCPPAAAAFQRLLRLPPQQRAREHPPASAAAAQAASAPGPQLHRFQLEPVVDVLAPDAALHFRYAVDSPAVGFLWGVAHLRGPDGALVSATFGDGVPDALAQGVGAFAVNPFMVPGTWSVSYVLLVDAANHETVYGQSELARVETLRPAPTATVLNRRGGDAVAPAFVRGEIRNPSLSLHDRVPGTTDAAAPLIVDIWATDGAGGGLASGVQEAWARFCVKERPTRCFTTSTWIGAPLGSRHAQLTTQSLPRYERVAPGVYTLSNVTLRDHAMNWMEFDSIEFGGTTDFSASFDTTVVTVTR